MRAGADAVRHGRGGAIDQRAAHAVALGAGPLLLVGLRLGVEEGEEGRRVAFHRVRAADRAGQRHELRPVLRLGEVEGLGDRRRAALAVEGIGHQHDIALGGQPAAHVAEHRAQAADVRPDQHGRPLALALRIEERGIAGPVGGLDVDVLLRDGGLGVSHARGHARR